MSLSSLPLFPLGTVQYPGGELPLRIFEVRYLDMIGQCRRNDAPFGVVALQQGHEVRRAGAPVERFHTVGTLARIVQFDATQPGLMTIRCVGGQRFRASQSRQLPHGLWTADAELLPPDLPVAVPDDLQIAATLLEQMLDRLRAEGMPESEWPIQPPLQPQDCGWLSNRWCELLPLPLPMKQRLMELDNPLVRLELAVDQLARLRSASGPAA